MRQIAALAFLAAMFTGCGGGDASDDVSSVSKSTMEMILNSQYGAFFDRVHPQIQAKTTKSDFISCQALNAPGTIPDLTVRVVATNEGMYRTLQGQTITVTRATVELSAQGERASFVFVWTRVDNKWRLVDIPDDDSDDTSEDCLEKL
jgi:hypothetical protein